MALIEKSAVVDAPIEAVYDYMDDPTNVPDFAPGVERVEVLRRTDERVGDSFRLIYRVIGIDFPITFAVTEAERPHTLASRMEGAMTGEFRWQLDDPDGGTEIRLRIDYEVKGGAVGRAFDALMLERMNEKNAEQMVENLKARAESATRAG
jgi:carbon monoxide dehydrogenase subunit G